MAIEIAETKPRRPKGSGSLPVNFAARWTSEELEEIKERARAAGMPASEYVKRCALGLIGASPSRLEDRLATLEERMGRIETRVDEASSSSW